MSAFNFSILFALPLQAALFTRPCFALCLHSCSLPVPSFDDDDWTCEQGGDKVHFCGITFALRLKVFEKSSQDRD